MKGDLIINDLYILDDEKSGTFTMDSPQLPLTIPPQQEVKIPVHFDPGAGQAGVSVYSAYIYAQSNDPAIGSSWIAELDANIVGSNSEIVR
jgi:hypothetical protein